MTKAILGHIEAVIKEWRRGCSVGTAGECDECTEGALASIRKAVDGLTPANELLTPAQVDKRIYAVRGPARGGPEGLPQ